MKCFIIFALLSVALCSARVQAQFTVIGEADTKWPGIHYQLYSVLRYPPGHLLIGVRLQATPQAPADGTLIGFAVPIPPNATKEDISAGRYAPRPLSLASSIMVDDVTQKSYSPVKAVPPPGKVFFPSEALDNLTPGQTVVLSVQFVVPPPPPPGPDQTPVKQTLSFLFPNAKGSISHVPLPPPNP
jgi:hypothetical protein